MKITRTPLNGGYVREVMNKFQVAKSTNPYLVIPARNRGQRGAERPFLVSRERSNRNQLTFGSSSPLA